MPQRRVAAKIKAKVKRRRTPRQDMLACRAGLSTSPWMIAPAALESIQTALAEERGGLWDPPDDARKMRIQGGVAFIPIWGALQPKENWFTRWIGGTAYTQLERELRYAANDSEVQRIVLLIDSPGGSAMGTEEVAQLIRSLRDDKPIVAAIRGFCASAAYYLAAQCSRIVASPSSTIGSIGTIWTWVGTSRAWSQFGVDQVNITHGRDKAFLAGNQPLTDHNKGLIQRWVSEYGEMFERAVAAGRGISVEQVRANYGGGQVWSAPVALTQGLIDQIGSVRDAAAGETAPAPVAGITLEVTEMKWSQRVRACLFALGLLPNVQTAQQASEASDDTIGAVLSGIFAGNVPANDQQIIAGIYQHSAVTPTPGASTAPPPATPPAATNPPAQQPAASQPPAQPPAPGADSDEIRRQERARVADINASANLLRDRGFAITDEHVQQAIDSGASAESIAAGWVRTAAAEPPINVRATGSEEENVSAAIVDAICLRCETAEEVPALFTGERRPAPGARQFEGANLSQMLMVAMQRSGYAQQAGLSMYSSPDDIARAALSQDPHLATIGASSGSINRPGSVPAIMAAVANRILAAELPSHVATYEEWSARMMDVADFHPRTLVETDEFGELDRRADSEDARERQLDGRAVGWFQAEIFANKVGLTIRMIADNNLDQWARQIRSLRIAPARTLNRLHLQLLAMNPNLLDGSPLFHANHRNLIASGGGGAPSDAQFSKMRQELRNQKVPGNEARLRGNFAIALTPSKHEDAAEKLLLTGSLYPQTTADRNIWNGTGQARGIRPVTEPDLDDYDANAWYAMMPPSEVRVFVHAFRQGHGPRGNQTTWFDPDNETRWTKVEVHMGAGIAGRRGVVKNAGN